MFKNRLKWSKKVTRFKTGKLLVFEGVNEPWSDTCQN